MAHGSSLGRERVILVPGPNGITAMSQQHPGGHQEELNQELLAVSFHYFHFVTSKLFSNFGRVVASYK